MSGSCTLSGHLHSSIAITQLHWRHLDGANSIVQLLRNDHNNINGTTLNAQSLVKNEEERQNTGWAVRQQLNCLVSQALSESMTKAAPGNLFLINLLIVLSLPPQSGSACNPQDNRWLDMSYMVHISSCATTANCLSKGTDIGSLVHLLLTPPSPDHCHLHCLHSGVLMLLSWDPKE